MRRVLNILQATSMAFPEATEETVYTCVGHPLPSDMAAVANWLLNDDFASLMKSKYPKDLLLMSYKYALD